MNNLIKKKLESNILKLYFFESLFMSIAFTIPTIVLFWLENGLSFMEIMILQSFFALMIVLIEVPSGYIADIIGRKKTIILALELHQFSLKSNKTS